MRYSWVIQEPVGYTALSSKSKDRAPRFQSQTRPETLSQGWANVQTVTAAFLSHLGILKTGRNRAAQLAIVKQMSRH